MFSLFTPTHFASWLQRALFLIAQHGHLRRVDADIVVRIWQTVRTATTEIQALLARLQAGTLRRYPARRPPRPGACPRRRCRRGRDPFGWVVHCIPETSECAGGLSALLQEPDLPALLARAPQLRRKLRPLCHMLGLTLPPPPAQQPAATGPDRQALSTAAERPAPIPMPPNRRSPFGPPQAQARAGPDPRAAWPAPQWSAMRR